jgi:hypothetical protein
VHDWLDGTFRGKHADDPPGERAVDLHPVRHDRGCDELESWNVFPDLDLCVLVHEDCVVEEVPCLTLRPFLLSSII